MFGIRAGRRPSRRLTGADHTRVCFSSYLGATGRHSGRPAVSSRVGVLARQDSTPYWQSQSPIPARLADDRHRRAMEQRSQPCVRTLTRIGAARDRRCVIAYSDPAHRPASATAASKDTRSASIDTLRERDFSNAHLYGRAAPEAIFSDFSKRTYTGGLVCFVPYKKLKLYL